MKVTKHRSEPRVYPSLWHLLFRCQPTELHQSFHLLQYRHRCNPKQNDRWLVKFIRVGIGQVWSLATYIAMRVQSDFRSSSRCETSKSIRTSRCLLMLQFCQKQQQQVPKIRPILALTQKASFFLKVYLNSWSAMTFQYSSTTSSKIQKSGTIWSQERKKTTRSSCRLTSA